MRRIDFKAVAIGTFSYLLLLIGFHVVENWLFWIEVGQMRTSLASESSFEIAGKLVIEPKILFSNFLFRVFVYGVPSFIVTLKAKNSLFLNSFVFGVIALTISVAITFLFNIKAILEYPVLTLSEILFSLSVCSIVGIVMQSLRRMYKGKCPLINK